MAAVRVVALAAGFGVLAAAGCGGDRSDRATEMAHLVPATTSAAEMAAPVRSLGLARVVLLHREPMRPGDEGAHVVRLQKALVRLGYDVGPIDGKYGSELSQVVAAFQRDHDLIADGIAGRRTIRILNREVAREERG
jgi:peptidoglycan hydrolase-like protein with peptidoglycan-binding domain